MSTPDQPLSGRMESLHFARLLARFWVQGFSGSFRARGGAAARDRSSKEVLFERGRIAWAASDDAQDSIKSHLVSRGILRTEQWRLAQEKAGSAHPRQALLEMGFLTARELHDADRERICGIILGLFNWVEGDYAVSPSPLPPGTPNLQIDPRDLVLEGIMASGDRDRVLEEIGSLDAVLVVRPDDLARASLSLPVELVDLMGKADGTRSVAEICALSPLQDFMICAAFAGLKALGLATAAEGANRAAPPAPPRAPAPARGARRAPRMGTALPAGRSVDPQRPRLPLDDEIDGGGAAPTVVPGGGLLDDEGDPGNVPVTAAPPPGLLEFQARHAARSHVAGESHMDEGTRPIAATPPDGTHSSPLSDGDGEDDSGTQPMTATPPGGTRTVRDDLDDPGADLSGLERLEAASCEDSAILAGENPVEEEREGEADLTPGIPVPPPPGGGGDRGLLAEEIETVVQIFSTATQDDRSPDEAGAFTLEQEIDSPSLSLPEDDSSGEEPGPSPGVDPGMADAPTWIYEPSGGRAAIRGYSPWVKWAGMAAGLFAVGTIVTLFFGAGSAEPGSTPAPASEAAGPPPIEMPVTPGVAEQAPASIFQPEAASAPREEPARGQEAKPSGRTAGPGVASLSPQRNASLASPQDGNILLSGRFRDARTHLGAGRLREAASGFEASLAGRRGLYTVQLALACSPETVARANRSSGGAEEFFILPKEFDGRACYRLLWGAYPGRKSADSARASVPVAFRKSRDAPFVAPI